MPSKLITTERHNTLNTFRENTNEIAALVANSIQSEESLFGTGFLHGWDISLSGGSAEQPQYMIWSKGTNRVRVELTWGTSGGEDGNVTRCVVSYSENSGSTWVVYKGTDSSGNPELTNGFFTISYDSLGNFQTGVWS